MILDAGYQILDKNRVSRIENRDTRHETMQTKQQIQQLLASAGASVNKRLGQHFLIDLNLMRLLVESADIKNNDIVLEVGCGTGSLTEALADNAGYCLAIECDKALAKIAEKQLAKAKGSQPRKIAAGVPKNVRIINTDILETKSTISRTVIKAILDARYSSRIVNRESRIEHRESRIVNRESRLLLVANLPYSVAAPVILNLITGPVTADSMYVTVQKEVAKRITARPAEKHYGALSILLAATGEVKTIRVLKPTVFWPRPKVDSAMLGFVRRKTKASRIKNMELFNNTVRLFMQHRRKMLKTITRFTIHDSRFTIHDVNWPKIFEQCSIDPTRRPDQLSVQNYIDIANLCSERLNQG